MFFFFNWIIDKVCHFLSNEWIGWDMGRKYDWMAKYHWIALLLECNVSYIHA